MDNPESLATLGSQDTGENNLHIVNWYLHIVNWFIQMYTMMEDNSTHVYVISSSAQN